MSKVCIIGTTTWGITLGTVIAHKGREVMLWARTEDEAALLSAQRRPADFLPEDYYFPEYLNVTASLEEALSGADMVLMAVPSQRMRPNIRLAAPLLTKNMLVCSASKGLEIGTAKRMSQVIADEISPDFSQNICVLSGPNLAMEILKGLPAVTVLAADTEKTAKKAAKLVTASNFCAYTNTDIIGVELGGSLKNIIALGAGIADGLSFGNNAKSALITRGLTEISALGAALGANPLTFSGLAGLGDLIATCSSNLSRNHFVGVELTKGRSLNDIMYSMSNVAEGVSTTAVAYELARSMDLEMPVTENIYNVLYNNADPKEAARKLMAAQAAHELAGRKWDLFKMFRRRRTRKTPELNPD
ncbi:MAG: NAD(P)H-dependent glycerol-3-phosphate dehydrogenase [Dehalococcoides mccartyi]|jgi:Glycerol-3-phosphate dehydrogenase|uniref:Glycerol-3-phosphate dehydrogenase [NAD(P)+] n=1 Tax=Dehalococcoides mccartyi (strain ATCC BAA-2266 / KCTC 15142 / 195) TaxID=243164 RepID=GPDA_DEHM1|nr:NAD(P)H-dependent glycerol-3-phosphate dehydrogenase [Dehalococcoides mccartyi]Q3Z6P3.1 RecName: Full=Glycerol-3-phosphate dehydrogenase [NAD(P)+]; AltName: Full=NAD(P)H-dependent glycerol-3-phosphate dehydrogenase [Dehalococcoides mccartyi 195]AAW39353.1 glycerol-3-phosphate dehydrogenase, NAD-dependent [Dehalococcoides mccartyi 195]AQU03611.1 glycerol-3-phosphate dehydrogenase (NAD(P)(+)) [Dehalococcoides mccartyi]AQU04911.1 glycerol-3-phosphate dehydrogenase (NAD(P)(+)) [Dehalococcoides m